MIVATFFFSGHVSPVSLNVFPRLQQYALQPNLLLNPLCDNSDPYLLCNVRVYTVQCWMYMLMVLGANKTSFPALLLRNDCKSTAGLLLFSRHSLMLDYPPAHLSSQYIHNGLNSMLLWWSISILCFISSFYSQHMKTSFSLLHLKRRRNITVRWKPSIAH